LIDSDKKTSKNNLREEAEKTDLEEDIDKVNRIHDAIAQYWNWAYYDERCPTDPSWLLNECMKSIKSDLEPRASATMVEIEEFLKEHPHNSLSIVDVGCGPGGFIQKIITYFSEKYPDIKLAICGLDVSEEMIRYAKKHVTDPRIELLCESITNPTLKMKKEPFDLAIMIFILPWYDDENAKRILLATRHRLKPNGTIILLDFSHAYSPWRGLNFFSKTMDKMADMMWTGVLGEKFHLNKRYPGQIEALLKDAGFDAVSSWSTENRGRKKGMLVVRAMAKPTGVSTGLVIPEESHPIESH